MLLLQRTHTAAVQIKHRAESLISMNHFDVSSIRDIAQEVTKRWQQLVTCTEERHKLVTASVNFYKTAEQVCIGSVMFSTMFTAFSICMNNILLHS